MSAPPPTPPPPADRLAWGILGTGSIARTFAEFLPASKTGSLLAVASRSAQLAARFAGEMNVPRHYGAYDALLADPDVQAVYISTPHPQHKEWATRAAAAGKHVLCEKPLCLNHADAAAVIDAARAHGVFLMEAFMYRCHPQTHKLIELLRDGAVGRVRAVQATFSFHAPFDPAGRLFSNALGGGGILDVGCYPVSMARLVAGVAAGADFAEPAEVCGAAHVGASGVDEWAAATMKFPGGFIAMLSTGVSLEQENVVRVFGSEGSLFVPNPWAPARAGGAATMLLWGKGGAKPQEVLVESPSPLYALEADVVAEAVFAGRQQASPPAMTWDDTLGNMRALDRWRQAVGLVYESESRRDAL